MQHLTIDLTHSAGKMKPMHAVNNGPVYKFTLDQRISNLDAFRDAGIPYARTHDASFYSTYGGEHTVDVHAIFPDFSKDPCDPASYDFTLTDEYLRVIDFAGVKTFYRLGSKIEHWPKKYGTLPPADFQKWAVICEHIMRHYLEGAARYASEVSRVPVINAGDGANQHPSQTMLDLYSIYKTQGTLRDLTITMVGDLKYGRTVHSLLMAMSYFNPTFNFVACNELQMPQEYKDFCNEHGIRYRETREFSPDVINESDIIYMTRVQRERFSDLEEYERVKNLYNLHNSMLDDSKPTVRILHPLPRVGEISQDVDDNPKAYYFQQAQNGLYARQAIICKVLGINVKELRENER